ncbi:family 43 glycosylhydrolase [Actinoplanes sp. G11-F43]|uniref:family 43 glycosylhydrolase n=1 Tax=Actinoplanes sp. G11-F43 TaxID=3424130 RepID=UPI003D355D4D
MSRRLGRRVTFTALTMIAGVLAVPAPAAAAEDGLVLWYKLDGNAVDSSGNGRDGSVLGTPDWGDGLGLNGSDTYVKAPDDLLKGLDSVSVSFDVRIDAAQATPYFLYGFGNTDAATGYGNGYLFATGNGYRNAISLGNWSGEQNTRPADGHNLARGTWKTVTYTQTGTTGTLYEDGVAVATNTAISVLPSAIGGGATTANYFGRSTYNGDRLLKGRLRDVRVYDRALAANEVVTLAARANTEAVAADVAALDLGDVSGLTTDLKLPASGPYGSIVTWRSDDGDVISDAGRIFRPAAGEPDAHATLTATLNRGDRRDTKTFEVTVKAALDDAANAEAAVKALKIHNLDDVRGNLTLPADATWTSSDPATITTTGEVHRPPHDTASKTVTLTATVTYGTARASRDFTATVRPLPKPEPYRGYLFSYFTGEGTANGEQVYNALSNGDDPLNWREINNGNPVLTSTKGTEGLRDPFIIRSPEGDKFYQIATDLKIHGNGDWDASQRTGSKSIMVWESTDLVNWTDQRLVKVSPDTAGNTWAPEAFWSRELGAYVVFWASKLYAETDPNHTGSTYNKMMYATTRDFHTFSEPKVWKDPGYSVIDSTVIEHDGVYHRITKDERNNSSNSPCSKFLIQERSTDLLSTNWDFEAECIGSGALSQGEGPLVFKSNTEDKWYLFIDEYGGRGYVPFSTTDLSSGVWTPEPNYSMPRRPRHGTVLPVTQAEYDRISAKYEEPPTPAVGLRLRYQFDETSGTVARDTSGNNFNGAYVNTPAWGTGVQDGSFKLSGSNYVTIPNGVLKGAQAVTVSVWAKWTASTTVNQWIYSLGPDSSKYLFTSPRNGGNMLFSAITSGSWQAESKLAHNAALPGGSWQHIAVTIDGSNAAMYLNGTRIASASGVTVKPSELYDATKSYSGYVGRSLYAADPNYTGEVDDFRVYDTALSAAEILELSGRTTSIGGVDLSALKVAAIVDDAAGTVKLPVKPGSDVTALAPVFTLARGTTISPASGSTQDFSKPVRYEITGADGAKRTWTVSAVIMKSPILPGLNADPNISVFGDTFWIHATTDGFDGWSGTQFRAWSSKDLVTWTDHGVILDLGPDVTWADNSAWAPTIAARNGKYYFYFSGGLASGNTAKHLGVAVADSPAGPFTDLGRPLVPAGTYSGQMIDPAVFTDDDGKSYLYWGNGSSYQVPLNDDMISFDPALVKTYKPTNYNEGSFVIKRDGRYYFMWSENDTRSADYRVAYATGTSPLGPWSDRVGVILQKDTTQGILGPGHHSVVRVPGTDEWYTAYHRFAIPGGDGTHRETTIDRLEFTADGAIKPVVPTLESIDPVTIVSAGPDATGTEGSPVSLNGTVSNTANRATWTVSGTGCVIADPHAAKTTLTCADDGTHTVTLTAGRSSDTATVTVVNAAPVVTVPGGRPAPDAPIATRAAVTHRIPVGDPGADVLTCTVNWGDGTTANGTVGGGVCTARHTFTKPGVYRPAITVRDDDGATTTGVLPFVTVHQPKAGYVAGSGWVGQTDFAFVARGSAWIRLPDGRVLRSTSVTPPLIIGPAASFLGAGTIDGTSGYRFSVSMLNARKDSVLIKIWHERTGKVIHQVHGTLDGGGIVT